MRIRTITAAAATLKVPAHKGVAYLVRPVLGKDMQPAGLRHPDVAGAGIPGWHHVRRA